jgi:hypothetical protein
MTVAIEGYDTELPDWWKISIVLREAPDAHIVVPIMIGTLQEASERR